MALGMNRKPTNSISAKVLAVFVLVWLLSGLSVIIPGGQYTFSLADYFNTLSDYYNGSEYYNVSEYTNTSKSTGSSEEASFIIVSITTLITAIVGFIIALVHIYLVRSFSRFFVYAAIVIMWIYLIIFILESLFFVYLSLKAPVLLLMAVVCILLVGLFGLVVKNVRSVGIDTLESIVKNSCSVVILYPKSLIITLMGLIIEGLVIYFSILVNINFTSSTFSTISLVFNSVAVIWIAICILYSIHLALGTAFTSCKVDQTATSSEIDSSILRIMKAHLGSVAYGCSPLSIISQLIAIFAFPIQPLTFILGFFILILMNPFRDMALNVTILQGTDFNESTKKTFELIFKAPIRCLILFLVVVTASTTGAVLLQGAYSSIIIRSFADTSLYSYSISLLMATAFPFVVTLFALGAAIITLITCDLHDNFASNVPMRV